MQQATLEPLTLVEQERPAPGPIVAMPAAAVTPDDVLRIAVQSGASIDQLERLMALRERHEQAQERERKRLAELAFREDFAKFKAKNIVVPKTKSVQQRGRDGKAGPSYMQSELSVAAGLLQPALAECGFGYRFDVQFERGEGGGAPWCTVICMLEHRGGHVETVKLGGPPDDSGSKNALQEMQSSSTFLQRHALFAVTGTSQAGADNDGRGARGYRDHEDDRTESNPGDSQADAQAEKLVQTGKDKAMEGMTVLTDWWASLTQQQREKAMPHFKSMRDAASNADKKGRK